MQVLHIDLSFTQTLAIAGFALSCVNAIWSVFQYYDKLHRKLKIEGKHSAGIGKMYRLTITNCSQNKIYIKGHRWDGQNSDYIIPHNHRNLSLPVSANTRASNHTGYPLCLEPGEIAWVNIAENELNHELSKGYCNKFRIVVFDTLGKKYTSKWMDRYDTDKYGDSIIFNSRKPQEAP